MDSLQYFMLIWTIAGVFVHVFLDDFFKECTYMTSSVILFFCGPVGWLLWLAGTYIKVAGIMTTWAVGLYYLAKSKQVEKR